MASACGVLCSECPAYQGTIKGTAHQQPTVEAWHRIYGLNETPEHIAFGGCLRSDEDVFHTSCTCTARLCCWVAGFSNCADCPKQSCAKLERVQKVWDEAPNQKANLSTDDFANYASPYCGHRERLEGLRAIKKVEGFTRIGLKYTLISERTLNSGIPDLAYSLW